MSGTYPQFSSRVPSPAAQPHSQEAPQSLPQPAAILAALETELEHARADYAARPTSVGPQLEEIGKRIADFRGSAPSELLAGYALLEASLYTLQARFLSHSNRRAALGEFKRAVELFEQYSVQVEQHKSSTRFLTDWGIALHRIERIEESIKILSRICQGGAAPAEAFGYLGYGELARGDLAAAEAALRKGLDIAPVDLNMSSYLARVLELAAKKIADTQGPDKAEAKRKEATEQYCRAAEIARSLADYSWAGRNALRALRIDPMNEQGLDIAVESYRNLGKFRRTLLILERFLTRQPGHARALGMKGVLLRDMGELSPSIQVLRSIPADSPDLAWVRSQLALSLSSGPAADWDSALKEAKAAAAIAPDDPFVYRVLGFLQIDRDDEEAAIALARARQLGDTSEDLVLNLCRALASTARYEEAKKELLAIVAADPRSSYAQFLLGWCEEHLEHLDRAVAHYRKASRLTPEEPTIFVSLMRVLDRKELRAQAMDEIESRLSGPLRHMALWCRGRLEMADGEWKSALASLSEADKVAGEVQANDALPGILVNYGEVLRQVGEYNNAEAVYDRAIALSPSRDDVLFGQAMYHCEVAEFEDAEACVAKVFHIGWQFVPEMGLRYLHGWCKQHLGDFRGAVDCYTKALDLSEQKNPWYRKGLANALMNFDRDQAHKDFARILEEQKYQTETQSPLGNTDTVGLLGWCNYRLEFYDEAIRLFETALSRSGDDPATQFDLALAYLASGRIKLAIDAYQRGYEMTANFESARQKGLYYIALFDLADARRQKELDSGADLIFQNLVHRLDSLGLAVEGLPWFGS
jgi:tetratricopeptide (TPR) repeat protein